jgi:hypothetical protein
MPYRQRVIANAAPPASPKRRRRNASGTDWVLGTLVELDPGGGRLTVRVSDARRPDLRDQQEIVVDVEAASVRATDGDGDGQPGLTDLFPGDIVRLELEPRDPGEPLVAERVQQCSVGAPKGGLRRLWFRWQRSG